MNRFVFVAILGIGASIGLHVFQYYKVLDAEASLLEEQTKSLALKRELGAPMSSDEGEWAQSDDMLVYRRIEVMRVPRAPGPDRRRSRPGRSRTHRNASSHSLERSADFHL